MAAASPVLPRPSLPASIAIVAASLSTLTPLSSALPLSLISLPQWLGPKGAEVGGLGEAALQDVQADLWEGGQEAL